VLEKKIKEQIMALYVNTNVSSINSQRNLNKSTNALNTAYNRLASGFRINSAKDDAAGLQISNRMTSQINGLTQGNRNANDAISMTQATEGALDEVTEMLQRMRTLALESANGTNSSEQRTAIQAEIDQLSSEITRIGTDTTFGDINLFDSDKTVKFQVGANANQTIDLNLKGMSTIASFSTALDLTSASASQDAITTLDGMIKNVDSYRGTLGAVQNRLESTISNQENVIANISDARSRIRDVDYASETANYTQQQILQQMSTSILAQANQKNSIALSLLG
jgi:flagellin